MSTGFAAAAIARRDGSDADGIHLLWIAPPAAGYSLGGWDVQRRKAQGRREVRCHQLSPAELDALHRILRIRTPFGEVRARQAACPEFPRLPPDEPADDAGNGDARLRPRLPAAAALPRGRGLLGAVGTAPGGPRCGVYDIRLLEGHRVVEVRAGLPAALAIALRDGKAVEARTLIDPSNLQRARFEDRDVDQVLLYCGTAATSLEVCLDVPPDPEKDEQSWAGEQFIAKGIQVPIRTLDPTLGSQADEEALATSRLLGGETFDPAAFHDVAELMNAAAADAADASPVWASTVTRDEPTDPYVELRPWSYALALLVDPAWRRMLGFGLLDRPDDLVPGESYDYRITGRFRRRDLEERLHGFQSVPGGTTLPTRFALGPVSFLTPEPVAVEQRPTPPDGGLTATGRKGIALVGDPGLTLSFPMPTTSVVLELAAGSNLSWAASTTDFLPGLPINTLGGDLPAERRVTIETGDPVDTITLSGSGFLYGVREVLSPPGTKPDDVVTRSVVLPGVVFADTPAPEPPLFLGTLNLQQPTLPASPSASPPEAPASLGFRLNWLPPPPSGVASGQVPWPPDLGAFPPFDVLGFRVERRRVDTSGPFEELDGAGVDTLVFGSRSGRADPPALRAGIDLEVAFPEDPAPVPPVAVFMSLDDVLVAADHTGPPPASLHQYRIFSVDAIGRSSADAQLGSVVRLEKRQPPPKPVGPPGDPPAGALAPRGVQARALQAIDPDLTTADRTLLGTSENAVVLEWGWTQAERDHDPHATEFRVYWQPHAPDVVSGTITGAPTVVGDQFELPATIDRPLAADAMQGRYLGLPDYPFKVASHTAGQSIVLRVERSPVDASRTPAPASFEFRPVLAGAEQRPPAWAERTAVVALTGAERYQHVFRDLLALDADRPPARVWAGVSAADAQTYVADALAAGVTNGGRPGNESAIVAAVAAARYLGRPTFTVPPPLADVPELVTDEPAGETVTVLVDLPGLLPAVTIPAGHRVQFDRLGLDQVSARMSARADGTIGAALPGGVTQSYTLPNPTDQGDLLAQIRSSTPARVEGRFLMDFLLRFAAQLEPLWVAALPDPVDFGALTDTLPPKAERYVHRIRLADAAGHLSTGAAIAPQIVRVPSLRSPAPPQLTAPSSETGVLAVEARVRDAFDLSWVVIFTTDEDAAVASNGNVRTPAQLLRLPNRRDLYPNEGIRLRLADGTLVAPSAVLDASAGTVEVPDRVLTATIAPGHDRRVALWSVALTRDGVPSRFAGPVVALTGPAPLVAPSLTVVSAGGTDTAQWTALAVPALLALERSTDAGTTWRQVSPWLADGVTTYALPSASGDVRYRPTLRADRGRRATGTPVAPS